MKLERKCKCPTSSHGHKPGKCVGLATEPDELCDTCREKTAGELPKIAEPKPLAHLSKRERRLRALR
jgi:hypothetical protein